MGKGKISNEFGERDSLKGTSATGVGGRKKKRKKSGPNGLLGQSS